MTAIEMPMKLKDIPRFERQNNISVSVYGWEPAKENEDGEQEVGFAYVLRVATEVTQAHDIGSTYLGKLYRSVYHVY